MTAAYVSVAELEKRAGLPEDELQALHHQGMLDAPQTFGRGKVGWTEEYVAEWLLDRPAEEIGLTPAQLKIAREAVAPLMWLLDGQPGFAQLLTVRGKGGGFSSIVVAQLRAIRRALWPSSRRLAILSGPYYSRTGKSEAERRRLRAVEYPEPMGGGIRD